jgi:uncharacterized protein YceK
MLRAFLLAVATCAACAAGGCGTVENLQGTDRSIPTGRPYGGVRYDAELGMAMLADTSGGHGGLLGRSVQLLVLAPYFLAVDLPLSAVGDSLTLPLVYPRTGPAEVTPPTSHQQPPAAYGPPVPQPAIP